MRKDDKHQKKQAADQLSLFSTYIPVQEPVGGTEKAGVTGDELSSRLERQRTLTEHLLEQVVDYGNLQRAYKQVKANGGSSGVDSMDIASLRQWLGKHHNTLCTSLLNETYEVQAVRKVEIPSLQEEQECWVFPLSKTG